MGHEQIGAPMINFTIPPWLTIAEKELGISEIPGAVNNPRIVEYHKSTNGEPSGDEVSWCSSFVNYCIKNSGLPGTNSKLARSWMTWGVGLKIPAFGCVVVLSRGGSPKLGHVGFYVGNTTDDTLRVLGGNQGDKVSIENFQKFRVVGYRWP